MRHEYFLQLFESVFEIEDVARYSLVMSQTTYNSLVTHLLGISLFVITSYPTQDAPTFAQLEQLGSLWSHRFLRERHLLQALTLRKLELWPASKLSAEFPVVSVPFLVSFSEEESSGEHCRRFRLRCKTDESTSRVTAIVGFSFSNDGEPCIWGDWWAWTKRQGSVRGVFR